MMTASAADKNKKFTCTQCQQQFRYQWLLKQHVENKHLGVRRYVCDVCQKAFSYKHVLQHHMFIHTGEKSFKCNHCQQLFRSQRNLTVHIQRKHSGVRTRNHVCDVCQKACYSKCDLTKHMRIHIRNKPFECKYCDTMICMKNKLIYCLANCFLPITGRN